MLYLAGVMAALSAGSSLAAGTQVVRHAPASPIVAQPSAGELPKALSLDPMSQAEIDQLKQDLLSHLQRAPLDRSDGIDGCMQWVLLRHGANEPWMAVGYSLPWLRVGAVKINGAMRTARLVYVIEPALSERRGRGTVSVPGTRPGSGSIVVTSFADRSNLLRWLAEFENDSQHARRVFAGDVPRSARYLRVAPVSNLRVSSSRTRCSVMAAECRRYVAEVDDDARWMRPGGSVGETTPAAAAEDLIPLAPGLRSQLAIEDMCPFSRQGMVEGPINTRAAPVARGITEFGIPGNASLTDALKVK